MNWMFRMISRKSIAQPARSSLVFFGCWIALLVVSTTEEVSGQEIASSTVQSGPRVSFVREVAPVLRKYCGGCHSAAEREGDFSVANYDSLMLGTPDGAVIVAKHPEASRLLQLVNGEAEPKMPPEDELQPSKSEMELVAKWIREGAENDSARIPLDEQIRVPKVTPDKFAGRMTTAVVDVGSGLMGIGRFGSFELTRSDTRESLWSTKDLPGKVNQIRLSSDKRFAILSTGIPGVGGQVVVVNLRDRVVEARLQGHSDAVYCACMSNDGKWIASGSYDKKVLLWDWQKQSVALTFSGHNGPVYDLDIDASGKVLATASGDQTVKLWGLKDGTRLDTFGQPEGEMQCVRFLPDGKHVIASGADRQLRVWQIQSKEEPAINPLKISRTGHEQTVTQIVILDDTRLVSLSEDRTAKLWSLPEILPLGVICQTVDQPVGFVSLKSSAKPVSADSDDALVVDYRGEFFKASLPTAVHGATSSTAKVKNGQSAITAVRNNLSNRETLEDRESNAMISEVEPNDSLVNATPVYLPATVEGRIVSAQEAAAESRSNVEDVDLFAFDAKQGEKWIFEVAAARDKSPLDSSVDILDARGELVLRTRLQALRPTYLTFRGKDSMTSDDFRVHKWQEMELNEYLYLGGEVVKLWLYPRGPDSGFKVYPGFGQRYTFFDTTPTSHALGEVGYVVQELSPDQDPLPNGLPTFPVYFQNDDDAQRRLGKDSRLTFTAPESGRYFARIRDARGFGGQEFRYTLHVRRPQPDFEITVSGGELQMPRGSGREWQVNAKRIDGLEGPIEIEIEGLPKGFVATNPLIIEAGQDVAVGTIFASDAAAMPEGADKVSLKLIARSMDDGLVIRKELSESLVVALAEKPEVQLKIVSHSEPDIELQEIVIRPGQTVSARVVAERNGSKESFLLGKEDAGRNLPHGCYVDNIGLNGLLITESQSDREFFITAAPWLKPQERTFHLRIDKKNSATTRPIRLKVVSDTQGEKLTGTK